MTRMPIVLNKTPTVPAYSQEPYKALMEDGYALPIDTKGNATVLLFNDVEDHIDGNGMAVLWILEGRGTFYSEGAPTAMEKGDVVIFDDNVEHGFEANDNCVAVNFNIGQQKDISVAAILTMLDAFEALRHAQTTSISETSPTF